MMHHFIHACAGSGKTQHIVDHCSRGSAHVRRLIITLTIAGQNEIEQRLQKVAGLSVPIPEVCGWYAFLVNHIVRPYLPLVFPDQRVMGFKFDSGGARESLRFKRKTNPRRYFSETGMVYKDNLEELSAQLMHRANGLVENRLRRIYDEIIIDEAQDISRSGLDVIEFLLHQNPVQCLLVGDSRQSLLDSSLASRKNKRADRQNLVEWYRRFEQESRLTIEEKTETYRFNQSIANFSDAIFPESLGFSATSSQMQECSAHDGVFLVAKEDVGLYKAEFSPKVLRASKASWKDHAELEPINFGVSKGRTFDRVMILATESIRDFCLKGKSLPDKSACAFYVAVTRARYSVAIAVNQNRKKLMESAPFNIAVWSPL